MSDLDKDFDELVKQINEKIRESAKLLEEAIKIADDGGLETLHMHPRSCRYDQLTETEIEKLRLLLEKIDFKPLFNQLDQAGWLSSSLQCLQQ
jgi:hypothetical protein